MQSSRMRFVEIRPIYADDSRVQPCEKGARFQIVRYGFKTECLMNRRRESNRGIIHRIKEGEILVVHGTMIFTSDVDAPVIF